MTRGGESSTLHKQTPQKQCIKAQADQQKRIFQVNLVIVRHGYSEANENVINTIFVADPRLTKTNSLYNTQPLWAGETIKTHCLLQKTPIITVSSNMIRAMMTASFLFPKNVIYVAPHLKEHKNLGQKLLALEGGNTTLPSPDYQLHKILNEFPSFHQMYRFDKKLFRIISKNKLDKLLKKKETKSEIRKVLAGGWVGSLAATLLGTGPIGALTLASAVGLISSATTKPVGRGVGVLDSKKSYGESLIDPTIFSQQHHTLDNFVNISFNRQSHRRPLVMYTPEAIMDAGKIEQFLKNDVCRILNDNSTNRSDDNTYNLIIVCHGGVIREFLKKHKYCDEYVKIGNCDVFNIPDTIIECNGEIGVTKLGSVCRWFQNPYQVKKKQQTRDNNVILRKKNL